MDGSVIGAIIGAGVAALGYIGSLAMLFQREKDNRESIAKMEANISVAEERCEGKIKAVKTDISADMEKHRSLFCREIGEIKKLLQEGEKRRDSARGEIGLFRESVVQRLAGIETKLGEK